MENVAEMENYSTGIQVVYTGFAHNVVDGICVPRMRIAKKVTYVVSLSNLLQ